MKSYKTSCPKEEYTGIKRTVNGKFIIRWNPVEITEGEDENSMVIVTFNETVVDKKPSYGDVVNTIIRERYSESDELAMARQSYGNLQEYLEYNAYVEQCKEWACGTCDVEYTPTYQPTQAEIMNQLRTLLKSTVEGLSESEAENVPALYDPWKPGDNIVEGSRRYNSRDGRAYECLQPHMTQKGWEPDLTPALWKVVHHEEWPEWIRPISAETAYKEGDKVTFESVHYISTIDSNTWSPVEYPSGWNRA